MAIWDPEKAEKNYKKHGVHFSDADLVFSDPLMLYEPDEGEYSEQRYVGVGQDANGYILVVIFTDRGDDIRLISARRANSKEVRRYEG